MVNAALDFNDGQAYRQEILAALGLRTGKSLNSWGFAVGELLKLQALPKKRELSRPSTANEDLYDGGEANYSAGAFQ